jgi:HAD superfamily hydrolase (TIGR01549 family)
VSSREEPGAVIWDFAGTLANRDGAGWIDALIEALDELAPGHAVRREMMLPALQSGFPWHTPDRPHLHLSTPKAWWGVIERRFIAAFELAGFKDAKASELATLAVSRYRDRPGAWRLLDDVVPTLEELSQEGWRHVILSNHEPELGTIASGLGLGSHVVSVLSSAVIGFEKPHPQAYALARQAAGTDRLWMVGDSFTADYLGAEAVGIPAILVRTPNPRAARFASSLHEAAEIVRAGYPSTGSHLRHRRPPP